MNVAFLSQGRLYIVDSDTGARELPSPFAEKARERAARSYEKHAWKSSGGGGLMSGSALWGAQTSKNSEGVVTQVTGVSRARGDAGLVYAQRTDAVAGIFEVDPGFANERRIAHRTERWPADVHVHPETGDMACSVMMAHPISNIALMREGGGGFEEITEGDSSDGCPRWAPGSDAVIVFHSAGVARDSAGRPSALGPYAIERLDLKTGEMQTLSEPESDLLSPRMDAEGNLYFIRRPYKTLNAKPSLWQTLRDIVLLPIRLCVAIFNWLNYFTIRNSGQPLANSGDAKQQQMDLQRMLIWGNLTHAIDQLEKAKEKDLPDLVPQTWQLVKRDKEGAETVLARGVLSYDLCKDGSAVFSNGSAIFRVATGDKPKMLHRHSMIEQVIALG